MHIYVGITIMELGHFPNTKGLFTYCVMEPGRVNGVTCYICYIGVGGGLDL